MTAGSGPRSQARRFYRRGDSFALVGPDDQPAFPLRPMVSRCDRFRFLRPGKLSGPPPFTPSLNVQRDDAHNNSGFGDLTPSACQSRGSGLGHDCVPNKGRVDFPPVLKSGHTHRGRAGFFHPMSAVPGILSKKAPARLSRPGPFAFDSGARVVPPSDNLGGQPHNVSVT
jgi:hypothetical protein